MTRWFIVVVAAFFLGACPSGVPSRTELVIDASGVAGPFAAARVRFDVQARVNESLSLEVLFPAGEGGEPIVGPFPLSIIVQGGAVEVDRYRWLGAHFATRGYVSVLPDHFQDLALFEADNARIALDSVLREARKPNLLRGLITDDSRVAIVGHSLGGVVATWEWLREERFAALGLLASYPAAGDVLAPRAGSPVLSISGTTDAKSTPELVSAGFARFAEPRTLALVEGMAHYNWTDGATEADERTGGAQTVPVEETRRAALGVLDVWLDAVLRDDPEAQGLLASATGFTGATVSH